MKRKSKIIHLDGDNHDTILKEIQNVIDTLELCRHRIEMDINFNGNDPKYQKVLEWLDIYK